MNREEAIRYIEQKKAEIVENRHTMFGYNGYDALCSAVDALRFMDELGKSQNDTLTLEELRGMDGEPVFVVPHDSEMVRNGWQEWCVIHGDAAEVPGIDHWDWPLKDYGKTWLAYRHKPEEVEEEKVMDRWGKHLGYSPDPCPNCGRVRLERYENGKEVCEKCGWCPQDHEYVDRDEMYAEERVI